MTTVNITYDCGETISISTALKDGQTLLGNPALGDTLLAMADALHDANCACATVYT